MKTFVTGASGHVGANLVRELVARGVAVKALVRGDTAAIEGLEVERVAGDLRDPASLRVGAAPAAIGSTTWLRSSRCGVAIEQQVFDVNVTGTKNILAAAERAGVARTVFCSSFGAVGHNPTGGPSDETHTVNPFETHLDYELSKAIAELEVHRAVHRGLDVRIVNPCGIVGAHDYKPSSVGQTILDFANRKMPAYVPGAVRVRRGQGRGRRASSGDGQGAPGRALHLVGRPAHARSDPRSPLVAVRREEAEAAHPRRRDAAAGARVEFLLEHALHRSGRRASRRERSRF